MELEKILEVARELLEVARELKEAGLKAKQYGIHFYFPEYDLIQVSPKLIPVLISNREHSVKVLENDLLKYEATIDGLNFVAIKFPDEEDI